MSTVCCSLCKLHMLSGKFGVPFPTIGYDKLDYNFIRTSKELGIPNMASN